MQRVLRRSPASSHAAALAHAIQSVVGYVPPGALDLIADHLGEEVMNLRPQIAAEAGLLSEPPGRHQVTICTGRTCARRGGASLLRRARRELGVEVFQATADGAVRLEPFRCFGQCAQAPNVRLDGSLRGAMTEKRFDLLLALLQKKDRS